MKQLTIDSLQTPYDVIIVGSGAAGLYAALCLPKTYKVALVTKEQLKTGASDWAQGGIAAAVAPDDSPSLHLEDTLTAGAGLCDPKAVEFLVHNAPAAIASLVEMGVSFDKVQAGSADDRQSTLDRLANQLALTREAAHSRSRVLHAADTTGRAIVDTLTHKVQQQPNITVIAEAVALHLVIQQNHCKGIRILYEGQIFNLTARAVILATGGGGQVFEQTTNPTVSTGDGVAIAARAGAILQDLEFFQFHPTALTVPGAPRFLISEAVRGEGAHLIDDQGERFAYRYHPAGELAPRDVVSRAIYNHLQATNTERVYLDLRPIPAEKINRRFPNIIAVCKHWGVDLFEQPIPVAPAAHYWMGGIEVNLNNATSIPGLYAIGETASTGVHGANRLASNSLLECIVYAAGFHHLDLEPLELSPIQPEMQLVTSDWQEHLTTIKTIRTELPQLVWQKAGICRTQTHLVEAAAQIREWYQCLSALPPAQYILSHSFDSNYQLESSQGRSLLKLLAETINLTEIAYLIVQSAIFRTESRGGHFRSDYPSTSTDWQVHTQIKQNSDAALDYRWLTAALK